MQMRRTFDEKGQVVLPKDIREYLSIKPGSEVVFEVENNYVTIKPLRTPEEIVEDFCNVPMSLRKNINVKDIKKMLDEQYEEEYDIR